MRRYAKNLKRTPIAMSKELRAFVQILVAEEHSISQNNGVQADEIISVTGPKFLLNRSKVGRATLMSR
jgi:hypothetical protein